MSTAEERMQDEIDELEQENRLLRARNERLEAELMQMQGRELKLQFALNAPVQEPAIYSKCAMPEVCPDHAHELYSTPPAAPVQEPVAIDGNTSDGYHTFNELYEFRKAYNAALFNEWAAGGKCSVHKSWCHHNGEMCFGGGWFIVVAVLPQGQISNHYEAKDWDLFSVQETERALFEFDGHTGADVVARLKAYTTPPAAQPALKPLTDEQISQLADKHLDVGDGSRGTHYVYGEIEFARAIEEAHGITEKGQP